MLANFHLHPMQNMPFTSPIFTKLKYDQQLFVKNSYNKFLENQNNSLVPDTGSWIAKQT